MSEPHNHLIPALRYRDAHAAIRWLREAFGFEARLIVDDDEGGVRHSQLVGECGMIMVGSHREEPHMSTPSHVGGVNTQGLYLVVADADAHCERALAAGAQVVHELCDQPQRGRFYSCLDPEGYLWNVGTYDPWEQ
jgi:uncharacterized glyoxalase superfamily protein PhnB